MALTRWSPFATLPSLFTGWEPFPVTTFRAPLDVQRTEGGYRLQSALPGFKPEDVNVTLEQGTLTITARRSEDTQSEQGRRYLRREVFSGSYRRRLVLPAEITAEDITATLENGVLTVDVRHTPANQAVRIPVAPAALPEQTEQTEQTEQAEQPAA
jgi:HSP20 family protein